MANQLVPSWEYDVFLSFRGEDTRTNFTNHLYHALVRHGIHTFLDDSELPTGEEISSTLLKAIENSRISVIVFSENYASSRWCLDELVHILECRNSKRQMTRPIFYKVDPSDVRHQKNSYGVAFAVPSRKYENDPEKVQRWRTALTEAANLKGDTLNEKEYEATFIDRIVEEISIQVSNRTCLNVARYPVGIESCAKEVEELLGVSGNDHRVVGIWGTSGIGKTTIAKAVYNAIAHKFEGSCFLADVRETLTSHEGVIKLQNTLLSKVLRGTELKIDDVHHGINLIKNRLRQKKILLILDDVDKLERLKDWVDVDCFGEGSRVIITTKDRSLLDFYGGHWIYEVQQLGYNKALELFSWNAFERNRPPDDYLSLARRAIAYAQGLPLALNIIGSYLRNKSIGRWQDVLNSYDGEPYTDIQVILRKSYDAWNDCLQQVFLDIACFFKGENKDYVLQILRSSTLKVCQDCIEVLVEKAIITIEDNQILMHDLLQTMGKQIVYEESRTEPGKRSRLWDHEDVYHVLTENQGTKKIRSIVVELPESNVMIPLNPESFLRMNLAKLTWMNLKGCEFLEKIPDLSGSSNIKHLNLSWCKNLVEVDDSVGFLDKLVELDLSWCPNLTSGIRELPSSIAYLTGLTSLIANDCELQNVPDLSGSPNIRLLHLSGCEFLKKIPDLSGSPNLEVLDLNGCTSLVEVDDSVGFLDKLKILKLSGCSKLTRFVTRLGSRSLVYLSLDGCRRLESFPEIEGEMESLYWLDIEKSGIRELPSIAYFTRLRILKASGCDLQNIQPLPFGKKVKFDEVSSWLSLYLEGCNLSESDFLVPLDCWSSLRELNLSRNNFVSLPNCISKVVNLEILFLRDCKRLREIPVLPTKLEKLYLDDCTSLDKIPKLPPRLARLSLCNCSGLSADEVAKLENNLLNEEIYPRSKLNIIYPGNEVPKWFSYISNHPTTIQPLPEYEGDEYDRKVEFVGGSEFRFEIPLKLQVGETLLGLALSFVLEPSTYYSHVKPGYYYVDDKCIFINGKKTFVPYAWYTTDIKANHVRFALVDLEEQEQQGDICQVVFRLRNGSPTKSCGMHCLLRNKRRTASLRPRPRGSSDIVDDESEQQQQWLSSSSEPADDHPKRRQIDPIVPFDIEEDEEQEQPSASDDPQFLIS
ncbi:unnamed protein product [Malus baccata var. baccata]